MKKIEPKIGHLLISEPEMSDPNFKRSVILLTSHDCNETIGFILNQSTDLFVHDIIDDFPIFNSKISIGGPVQKNTLHFIHSVGEKIENSIKINENLYWSGNIQNLKELIVKKEVFSSQVRFFAGYSGWTSNQLSSEIEEKSWIVVPGDSETALRLNNKELWKSFIKEMDQEYAIWANMPEDPCLN